jgi:hypothetical protein
MKNKRILFLLAALVTISMVSNSCKKDAQTSIQALFTKGKWQLASVIKLRYLGASQLTPVHSDTMNTTCDSTQIFTFTSNTTCSYTNFDCIPQKVTTGTWSLSKDQLFLMANITLADTLAGGKVNPAGQPFIYTQIVNLGQYSMVLQTGNIATYYTSTTKRTIIQYGFVHPASSGN